MMKGLLPVLLTLAMLPAPGLADSYHKIVANEFGSADVLQWVTESALPEPQAGEVRIKVLTASASLTDVMVRKGIYAEAPSDPPITPGYDLVGVVDKLGEGVTGLAVGQRVAALTVWGAYSEYTLQAAQSLVPVPDGLDDEAAVTLILSYTTAYQMLHRLAQVQPGQTVLIHGASGAVGTALAQLGKVAGLNMIGTASAPKHAYVESLGVTPIDYKTEDFVERTLQLTDNQGVDAAFDAIGVANFKRSYKTLNNNGDLVVYGLYQSSLSGPAGKPTALLGELAKWFWQQWLWKWFPEGEKTTAFYLITGMREEHPDWFREDLATLFELARSGKISPQVWKTMPLADAASAHRLIEERAVKGKIVLRVSHQTD